MGDVAEAGTRHHTRSKSSVLRSLIHRRNNADATGLPPAPLIIPSNLVPGSSPNPSPASEQEALEMGLSTLARQPRALEELQLNQQGQAPRSPPKVRAHEDAQKSPPKGVFATVAPRSPTKEASKLLRGKDAKENAKPKKTKSVTNLVGLLSRPKSFRNLNSTAAAEAAIAEKGKENRTPPDSLASDPTPPTPIYAQFCSQMIAQQHRSNPATPLEAADPFSRVDVYAGSDTTRSVDPPPLRQRPKSFQPQHVSRTEASGPADKRETRGRSRAREPKEGKKSSTWGKARSASRGAVFRAFGLGQKEPASPPRSPAVADEPAIDPKDIDRHLEALLDRRNIPENQRFKMRNLADTIKMEFIRQDWAEARTSGTESAGALANDGSLHGSATGGSEREPSKAKHGRVKSLTLGKSSFKGAPTKKDKKGGTLGRHFRTKSTDSIASDRPEPGSAFSSNSFLAKVTGQQLPGDFVTYLRKVQKPELVEVGKLHKLRLLLRNERVSWAEDFIRQGGMKEIVDLLHRIMKVEWREEHEDALLHENLLCLKALCTTALALQYLHSIQATLLPALIQMIFDPDKKGPSEFTTRGIITSVLFTYIRSAPPAERVARARAVLSYLRDPEAKEEERPVSFVLEMRRDRPYRVWCKEVVSVTKEVFWIFLHNINVVALPGDRPARGAAGQDPEPAAPAAAGGGGGEHAYMARHFPQERPPVPAAPYVGGVEWDATNYLASHLDLLNAILACTPTAAERNRLRELARVSGFERCLGGSLRLCKEKFYPCVHDGLRTWVAAAAEDGWDVRDVRFGPPAEPRGGSPRKAAPAGRKQKPEEAPPRLEMPKLDFGLDAPLGPAAFVPAPAPAPAPALAAAAAAAAAGGVAS